MNLDNTLLLNPSKNRKKYSVLLGTTALLCLSFFKSFNFSLQEISTLLLIAVSIWPLIRLYLRGGDLFEPIIFISILYFIFYSIRAIVILSNPLLPIPSPNLTYPEILFLWNRTIFYVIAGLIAMQIGYFTPIGEWLSKKIPTLNGNWTRPNIPKISVIFVLLGIFTQSFILAKFYDLWNSLGLTQLISLFVFFTSYGISLLAIYYLSYEPHNRQIKRMIIFLVCLAVFSFIGYGNKEDMIRFLLILVIAFHYKFRQTSLKQSVLCFLIICYLIFPFLQSYRQIRWWENFGQRSFWEDLKEVPDFIQSRSFTTMEVIGSKKMRDYLIEPLYMVSGRAHGLDSLLVSVKMTPDILPFKQGNLIKNIFAALIPRFLWPGKPMIISGLWFGTEYWGLQEERWAGFIAITQLAQFYINSGLWGIVIGMFMIGVFYRMIYTWFIREINPSSIFIYTFSIIAMLSMIERDVETSYTFFFKQLLFMLGILYWITNKQLLKMNS